MGMADTRTEAGRAAAEAERAAWEAERAARHAPRRRIECSRWRRRRLERDLRRYAAQSPLGALVAEIEREIREVERCHG